MAESTTDGPIYSDELVKRGMLRPTDQAYRFAQARYERKRKAAIASGFDPSEILAWDQLVDLHNRCPEGACVCKEKEVEEARHDLRWFLWDQLARIGQADEQPPKDDVWTGLEP
jgi:hypothetical protein